MLRGILFAALGIALALLIAWWLVAFQPWYNRSLTWRIIAISSNRTVASSACNWCSYNPEFAQLLQERYVGISPEPVVREFEANGFECHRSRREHEEQTVVGCVRSFGSILPTPVGRVWQVVIYLDKNDRIERLFGAKFMDGP